MLGRSIMYVWYVISKQMLTINCKLLFAISLYNKTKPNHACTLSRRADVIFSVHSMQYFWWWHVIR